MNSHFVNPKLPSNGLKFRTDAPYTRLMRAIDAIASTFGGTRAFARAVGRTASSVQYWVSRGYLPRTEIPKVVAALEEAGLSARTAQRFAEKAVVGGDVRAADGRAAA